MCIFSRPPHIKDLEALEPAAASLLWIQENNPEPLDLTFTVEEVGALTTLLLLSTKAKEFQGLYYVATLHTSYTLPLATLLTSYTLSLVTLHTSYTLPLISHTPHQLHSSISHTPHQLHSSTT